MENKVWTAQEIKDKMEKDSRWIERGLVALYERQTSAEQTTHTTTEKNARGFNGVDAELLTSFACQIKYNHRNLTGRQLYFAKKKIMKYAGQLAKIANGEL